MSGHLLLVIIGPVQEFIAQARRTRDLWHGSHLLSEIGRAAARQMVQQKAKLIFPALEAGHEELAACSAPRRPNGQPPLSIANKLLAEVPEGVDPEEVVRSTRREVMRFWCEDVAAPVKRGCAALLASGIDAVWDEQIDTLLEFSATWAPLDDHAKARRAVEQAIAARKNLRDFAPWRHLRGNVPKSSLDGTRETVLRPEGRRDAALARKFRIADREQLDAVGLVKRAGGKPEQFVPVVNVAMASWIALAQREFPADLDDFKKACLDLGIARIDRRDLPSVSSFPFDAGILLPGRWKSIFKELEREDEEAWGKRFAKPLLDHLSEPYPYVACLVADGDRMGRAIERMTSPEAHRSFSQALSQFSVKARETVEQKHLGSLVYAGGDDVLAFLPVPEALACAETLRLGFEQTIARACPEVPLPDRPTLSVGIGIGHIMESLAELLGLGRQAEKLAKGERAPRGRDRNALAVLVDKRSGGTHSWRARWDEWKAGPVHHLQSDIALLEGKLSSRKVYEIDRVLRRLPKPQGVDDRWTRLLAMEVRRSLARSHAGEASLDLADIGLLLHQSVNYEMLYAEISGWINRMLVARNLAAARPTVRKRLDGAST